MAVTTLRDISSSPTKQTGATLIVGLIMLLVLTVVGVSGMNTATMELTMSGNAQFREDAFQMAEDTIDVAIARRNYSTAVDTTIAEANGQSRTHFETYTPVPDAAFSMGTSTGSISAIHFDITAVGRGPRNASSTHIQSFYVIGPGGN